MLSSSKPETCPDAPNGGQWRGKVKRFSWLTAHKLHRWSGLTAALWLAVLGLTGFFIDHREWRWQRETLVSAQWLPEAVVTAAGNALVRGIRLNPQNPDERLAYGEQGLWRSGDGGQHWAALALPHSTGGNARIQALEADFESGWPKLWVASDDGIWRSTDGGHSFAPFALAGKEVTALTRGATAGELIAVVEREEIYRVAVDLPEQAKTIALPPPDNAWPQTFTLARYLHDLHIGKGIAGRTVSLLINDFAGIAWLLLALSGLLYWWLPQRWKKRRAAGSETSPAQRRRTLAWLFNLHSSMLGLLVAIPLLYLTLTGVYWDHMADLGPWARSIPVSRPYLTPAFTTPLWDNWIDGVAFRASKGTSSPTWFVAGRMGVLGSADGAPWVRQGVDGVEFVEARRVFRVGEAVFIGNAALPATAGHGDHAGHGAPAGMAAGGMNGNRMGGIYRLTDDGEWVKAGRFGQWLKGREGMPQPGEVFAGRDGQLIWRGGAWLHVTDGAAERLLESLPLNPPPLPGVPVSVVFSKLHSGLLIGSQWKWVNDAVAILAWVLAITGLLRWWKRKWLPVRRGGGMAEAGRRRPG